MTSVHAQTQQVASASSIGIVPGNLTIDGKAYPVSYDTDEDEGSITIKVYDNAFNVKRSSVIPAPAYEYKYITEESNIVKGTIIYDKDKCNFVYGDETDSIINTPDDFLRFIYYTEYNYGFESLEEFKESYMCVTDSAGHYVIFAKVDRDYVSLKDCPAVGKELPYINFYYGYGYDPTTKKWIRNVDFSYWLNYDPNQIITWTVSSDNGYNNKLYPRICDFNFTDADKGLVFSCLGSQNLFNNDAKTEFMFYDYKEVSKEEYLERDTSYSEPYKVSKVISGTDLVFSRYSRDKFYVITQSIIDEDGTKLYDIDGLGLHPMYSSSMNLVHLDGSLYIITDSDLKGSDYYKVVHSFSPETGIKEVARVKASNASRTYNLAGQQVNADAKGIIIRDGKKFLNK